MENPINNNQTPISKPLAKCFRGFLPVVIDLETGGLNPEKDAILEIAIVFLILDEQGSLKRGETHFAHVQPFAGANIEAESLKITGIDPDHPFRFAVEEKEALEKIFALIEAAVKIAKCERGVLVGHNPHFDLSFIQQACKRHKITKTPFHQFTTFDTATLSGVALGETVLAKAAKKAGLHFDKNEAHSAIYDAEKTADLFCWIYNKWQQKSTTV